MQTEGGRKPAHMPARSTVHLWLLQGEAHKKHQPEGQKPHPLAEFLDNYVRAREVQADTLIDDILQIADDSMNDWVEREDARTGNTYIALNAEAIARAKLRVEGALSPG
jgi:hypothetical protein